MRILLVPSPPYEEIGGVSTHVHMLAGGLTELGHEVAIIPWMPPRPYRAPVVSLPGLALTRLSPSLGYRWMVAARHAYYVAEGLYRMRGRPDIVNVQNAQDMPVARRLQAVSDCGVVLTVHGFLADEAEQSGWCRPGDSFWGWLRQREVDGYAGADALAAVSTSIAGYLNGFEHAPVTVIHNGIDVQSFRPAGNGSHPGELRLCFAGILEPHKGIVDAVQALATVRREGCPARLLVAGEGRDQERARQEARRLGVQDAVEWKGAVKKTEMPAFYSSADVLLMPSLMRGSGQGEEPFPYTALEAMACGLPVVAYRTGGLPEQVDDSKTGFVVDAGDAGALGRAALKLADSGLLAQMGGDARRRVEELFSARRMAGRFLEIYAHARMTRKEAR
ncbi:MAG: glycosyltransferase family 4 protein [Candidatus Geothermincolia bacterium]